MLLSVILLKKKFLDLVRSGAKRQTIRVWPRRRLRPGQREFIPGLGRIRITAFERVSPEDLTDEDARLDGFETADQLRAEIVQLYPKQLAAGHHAYRIAFHLLPEEQQKK